MSCFNASRLKYKSSGTSLNDVIYTGSILQPDLMRIILNFRMFKYVRRMDFANYVAIIFKNSGKTALIGMSK